MMTRSPAAPSWGRSLWRTLLIAVLAVVPLWAVRTPARAAGPAPRQLSWCLKDFEWFVKTMAFTTPRGEPMRIEPFTRFILKHVFRKGMVEVLVLLPKGQGKTLLFAALAVFHLLITDNAQCFIVAADVDQADEMYRFAQHFVTSTPALGKRMYVRESTRRIRARRDQGFIKVIASDKTKSGGKKHSFNPTLALIDELHAHENDNAYTAMRSAAFKANGLVLNCTTAGHDKQSTLGKLRTGMLGFNQAGGTVRANLVVTPKATVKKSKDGRLTVCESKSRRTVMLEWACTDDDDLTDPAVVKLANPATWVTTASIEDAQEAPGITPWSFARYRANVWTLGFKSWLPSGVWMGMKVGGEFDGSIYSWPTQRRRELIEAPPRLGIQEDDDVFAFLDMARYRDSAAIVCVAPREGQKPAVWLALIERSGGEDSPIAYEPVKAMFRELDGHYRLLAAGYDPKYFDQAASELSDEGLPLIEFPQSNERLCPASANVREAILRRAYAHDGDPILAAHVEAAVVKDVGPDQFRLMKAKTPGAPPVDALIAFTCAHQLTFMRPASPPTDLINYRIGFV